ncbi:DUF2637 domain-containing protein [Streptomyces boninensis]|uniref:DUF2637 domain-containing protein n=1 Tax=Streptomyces boninensis TaxID=2039455 RepID=UPI003B2256A2
MRASPRIDAVLVQAVIAGALSFAHLHDIAEAAGQHGWKAWAYPVSVDLLLVAAWRRLRTLRETGDPTAGAWLWFTVALTASLGANVATAGLLDLDQVPAWLRILVAGWPALAFLGGTLLAHAPAGHEPEETAAPLPAPVVERVDPTDTPAPELLAAPPVPPALLDHARQLANAHRARTGDAIDTDTLRARLGVPAPMADAIATQLV